MNTATAGPLQLANIRVIDLSRMAPGGFCTMMLGDFGADVIRVEEPGGGRIGRARMGRSDEPDEREERRRAAFAALNRNKRSITLDLKVPQARDVLTRLCENADVFVEGFRPGVVERLGCDYETLSALNPRLVYCSISGYGQDGPYKSLVGHDINYISTGGALGMIGSEGGPPTIPYNLVADYAGGAMQAAIGILSALMARNHTGPRPARGHLHVRRRRLHVGRLAVRVLQHRRGAPARSDVPERRRPLLQRVRVQGRQVPEPRLHRALVLGRPLPGHRTTRSSSTSNSNRTSTPISSTPSARSSRHGRATSGGTTCAAPATWRWAACSAWTNSPTTLSFSHRGMVQDVGEIDGVTVRQVGIGPKLSETPGSVRRLGPHIGEHTDEILGELGYAAAEIANARETGALG